MLDAPVAKGDVVGKAAIKYAGETIAEVDLVAAFDVQRSTIKYIGDLLRRLVRSKPFRLLLLAVFAVMIPLLVILFIAVPARRRKKKNTVRFVNVKDMYK